MASFFSLITTKDLIFILLFIIYEVGYKLLIVNKISITISESVKHHYSEKIENIKLVNANENNKIKHALDKLLSLQIQHKNEERQALMNFLSNCNQWLFNLSKIKFDDYWLQNIKELKEKIENIQDEYFFGLHAERTKILLFIPNVDVNNATDELIETIGLYKSGLQTILSELLFLLQQQNNSSYEEGFIDEFGEGLITLYSVDNSKKIDQLFLEYKSLTHENFQSCMKEIDNLSIVAKEYLLSLEFNKA